MKTLITILAATLALQINASELLKLAEEIKAIAKLPERIEAIEARLNETKQSESEKFTFVLKDENGDGYVDDEWEAVIAKGQEIQAEFWRKAENYWGSRYPSPSGPGWHGSAAMPIIKILCVEPEYWFKNTARLPGRFQIDCPTRWGTLMRFFGNGDKVLVDDINYGTKTDAPVAIYVEPQTQAAGMTVRPFEQGIRNVVIQCLNGSLPVYLAQNQDRFWIDSVKILQHNGALVGVKHGPPLRARSYPWTAKQSTRGNVWLTDARFTDIQHEGPHSGARKQCSMLLSGANTIISNLNLYGWGQGPLIHNDEGLLINGITMHDADGKFYPPTQMLPYAVSRVQDKERAVITGVNAPNPGWYLQKRSPAPSTMGFYKKGEPLL